MRRRDEFITALPEPRAIDPRSGFNVPHSELVKEHQGNWVARRFADKPHPLDFPPPRIRESALLPHAQPEPPVAAMAVALMWEATGWAIMLEDGSGSILTEGGLVVL